VNIFLAKAAPVPAAEPESQTLRRLSLESLDGSRRIPLDGSTGWWRMAGSTGLEMPPFDVVRNPIPGVAGSVLQDVRTQERPVFVPIFTSSSNGHVDHLAMLDVIRSLVDPSTGEFRLIGESARSARELRVVYTEGLEGADGRSDSGIYWRKFGLSAVACQPFAQDRTQRSVEFSNSLGNTAFIGAVGDTDAIWPTGLGTAAVIGDNMRVDVASEVPVYPTVELVGPMDSFTGSLSPALSGAEWSVSVPGGLASGETFRMVTDPRARSFRVNGALAAGRVARGSQLRPFYPGVNVLDVSAPGATSETRVRVSWRELYRSLW
jgi:hypothetical protein